MTENEKATGRVDGTRRTSRFIELPLLSQSVRDSAARAANARRFQLSSTDQAVSDPSAPAQQLLPAGATQAQTLLVAVCSMCLGALLTYAWIGGQSPREALTVEVRPVAPVSAPPASTPIAAEAGTPARTETAAAVEASDPRTDAAATIGQWAAAWSRRDVERYLEFYAGEFVPPDKLSREPWEQLRRERILGKQRISVTIDELGVEMLDGNRAIARFAQTYEADSYREARAAKILILAREGDAWRIAAEINARDVKKLKKGANLRAPPLPRR